MIKYDDYPFDEVVRTVIKKLDEDPTLEFHQKYTCAGCGNRLGIEEPNKFYTEGACDNCSTITDIKKQGCNYMMVIK